jgi:protein-S-isoprenylcysteine O-methyltransferase Ste14
MKSMSQWGRVGGVLLLTLGALEVVFMASPFAGLFYAGIQFEPMLAFLSQSPLTAWLDGFFLNHSVVTTSWLLEWQREIGKLLFALGLWGFVISACQVYGNKILGRGVAKGFLYRVSRHPQYLCLSIAGWGLLTIWPRFLLLGLWVTMLFLYAGLARFEEHRMEERFGSDYRSFADTRSAFLPGSPVRRLFEATFGRLRPRAVGWLVAYAASLALAFSLAVTSRAYTRSHTATLEDPGNQEVVIGVWPKSDAWLEKAVGAARSNELVAERLEKREDVPIVTTILPSDYGMNDMYFKLAPQSGAHLRVESLSLARIVNRAMLWLTPTSGFTWGAEPWLGIDPDKSYEPVRVVFSQARKPYKSGLQLDEALDPSVRLRPLVIAHVQPDTGNVVQVQFPLPQNGWGPNVIMPVF